MHTSATDAFIGTADAALRTLFASPRASRPCPTLPDHDSTLDAALTLGTRAAAVTVSRPGANPPWSREL